MLSRYAVPLLCAAAIAFACAPRPHAAESRSADARVSLSTKATITPEAPTPRLTRAMREEIAKQPLATTVDVVVRNAGDGKAGAREVQLAFRITNRGDKKVELMFPSGQTHDFVVRDESGREVWRWSEGRMFTQALQSKLLNGSETTTYEETWPAGARHGRFTVVATLRSTSHAMEQTAEIVLP